MSLNQKKLSNENPIQKEIERRFAHPTTAIQKAYVRDSELLSERERLLVETHLKECEECRTASEIYRQIVAKELPLKGQNTETALK